MDIIGSGIFTSAINMLLDWNVFLYLLLGLIAGIWIGAIPGVSGMLAISIMLIPSYYLSPIEAIIFLESIYTGAIYGGGITAVLLNVPGAPGAVATGFDGYEMTKSGHHNEALGIGLMASVVGCFFGYLLIIFLFIPLANLVVRFGPSEMLMVVLFALTVIGLVRGGIIKTLLIGFLGLLIGTIGASPFGMPRGTFGIDALYEGIPLVPAILGMLAVSELFFMIEKELIVSTSERKKDVKLIFKGAWSYFKYKTTTVRSLIIGVIIGLLPAAGSTIASTVSYGQARSASRHPDTFGKGNPEGVAAAETANNSSEGGAMATMMAFGVPGSGATAILMAAFMIHGMNPGPYLVKDHMDFAYAIFVANLFEALFLGLIGLAFIYYLSRVVFVPTRILVPAITIIAVLGSLALRGLIIDVVVLLAFGILGYMCRKFGYPILSLVLGFMLGGLVDGEFVRTYLLFKGKYLTIFQRPIVVTLLCLTILSVMWPFLSRYLKRVGAEILKRTKS